MRSLYVCYLSLDDPLVHTQVVAYLEGLARNGHTIHLLTYEPALSAEREQELAADLAARQITWHSLRYHKRPSLPATIYDALVGAAVATRLVRRHRLDAVHARNHVPAATALITRRLTGCKLIFDMRGLMAEEYADAGRWRWDGLPFRITKRVERATVRAADGMVVLTNAVRAHLFAREPEPDHLEVIPCCADLKALDAQANRAAAARSELDAGERPILLYLGKFTGWYLEQAMVEFYATARERIPGLLLVILTQADRGPAVEALERCGVEADDYRIASVPAEEVGRFLAAADAGICFIEPCLSKISSSPTKIGEYLGGGLPVVSGRGIGDVDALLGDGIGVLVRDFEAAAYADAADTLATLIADPATAARCRAVAEQELSLADIGIPRYDRLYRAVTSAVTLESRRPQR